MPLAQEGDEYDPVRDVNAGEVMDLRAVGRGRLIKRLNRIRYEAAGKTIEDGGGELGSWEKT